MSRFAGAITALATPFKQGEIDFSSVKKLVRYQLDNGIQGLVVNGTTAESPCLDIQEVEALYQFIKSEVAGHVPLLVGTGSNSTQKTIEFSLKAQKWGAGGLLIVTPYYNKPPQRGLVAHYRAVAESVDIPILLYNVPGRTAVSLSVEATIELSHMPNIVGVKDATGDLVLGEKLLAGTSDSFTITSGDDLTFLDLALMGAKGVISVLSNIAPRAVRELLDRARQKDSGVTDDFQRLRKLTELLFVEANPIPLKAALNLMGIFETDEMRLPLVSLELNNKKMLQQVLAQTGLIK